MTYTIHNQPGSAVRLRRFVVGLMVAGSVFAITAADRVDARPRSTSEAVAAEAARTLDALASWRITRNPSDYVRFVRARESTAGITAAEFEIDPSQLRDAWAATSGHKQQAVLSALSQLGVPYRYLKSSPGVGFDCSGLLVWAFEQAGVEVPRSSRDQFRASTEIEHGEAEAGDLVYYPGHIAMYIGADAIIQSPNSGSHVEVVWLPTRHSVRYGDIVSAETLTQAVSTVERLSATVVNRAIAVAQ